MLITNTLPTHRQALETIDRDVLGEKGASRVGRFLAHRDDYAPTPLVSLPGCAAEYGVAAIHIKDEGQRLGLASFKALGGAYAVVCLALEAASKQVGKEIDIEDWQSQAVREAASRMTVVCATDGNHGRSVAQGAHLVGANCVIYIHSGVTQERADAIAAYGAHIVRIEGNYDDSVAEASRVATERGWIVVSDTSWPGYERIPHLVMQGYTAMLDEAVQAMPEPPTHVFIQAGVGGIAASVSAYFAETYRERRPFVTVVDPARAACIFESARAGHPVKVEQGQSTVMAMLECYEPSLVAWRILSCAADAFMTIDEEEALAAMRKLAYPAKDDKAIVAGESGGVGLAALKQVAKDPTLREKIGLGADARVFLINTEGATDPALFERLVGATPETIESHMASPSTFEQTHRDMTSWRHTIHAHPEFGFEEHRTASFITTTLRTIGLEEVVQGVGGTGVVATLRRGSGKRVIALRADMDALRIKESVERPHRSTCPNEMHGCGHDGHMAMLLGAAKLLVEEGGFDGTVRFVFQPAEEWGRGALAMLEDGLLDRLPFDEIYGLHNMPGYPLGAFVTKSGPIMSAEDNFEIVLRGLGGHASRPHGGAETMVPGCELVLALQTIVSRRLDPGATAVVSVTEFLTDGTRNVLPGTTTIRGDVRSFDTEVSTSVEHHMRRIVKGVAEAHGLEAQVTYTRDFVPLVNDVNCTAEAFAAAREVIKADRISTADAPITASEDFAQFLKHVPGCFAFLGNGTDSLPLHNSGYDFADGILLDGARFFTEIVRRRLPAQA